MRKWVDGKAEERNKWARKDSGIDESKQTVVVSKVDLSEIEHKREIMCCNKYYNI